MRPGVNRYPYLITVNERNKFSGTTDYGCDLIGMLVKISLGSTWWWLYVLQLSYLVMHTYRAVSCQRLVISSVIWVTRVQPQCVVLTYSDIYLLNCLFLNHFL